MKNILASEEQVKKATKDFLKKSKSYFSILESIAQTKKPIITYNMEDDSYSIDYGEESEIEKGIKRQITEIRNYCNQNILNY